MTDPATLRRDFPAILWDEPQKLTITGGEGTSYYGFACRYCIALIGIKGQLGADQDGVFLTPEETLAHIEAEHRG